MYKPTFKPGGKAVAVFNLTPLFSLSPFHGSTLLTVLSLSKDGEEVGGVGLR